MVNKEFVKKAIIEAREIINEVYKDDPRFKEITEGLESSDEKKQKKSEAKLDAIKRETDIAFKEVLRYLLTKDGGS